MLVPFGYRVLVKDIVKDQEMDGAILLPDSAKTLDGTAEIVKLGKGLVDKHGNSHESYPFKEGDTVIIPMNKECGTVIFHDTEKYKIFEVSDVLALVE